MPDINEKKTTAFDSFQKLHGDAPPVAYFDVKAPKTILYSPGIGGKPVEKPVSELEKELNFTWTESMMGPLGFDQHMQIQINKMKQSPLFFAEAISASDSMAKEIVTTLANPVKGLVLYKIRGAEIGYGVYTEKRIEKETIIGFYMGEYGTLNSVHKTAGYLFALQQKRESAGYEAVDALRYRNLMAFLNHLPAADDLDDYEFLSPVNQENVAVANLKTEAMMYNGLMLLAIKANTDIEPKQMLGLDYGKSYWPVLKKTPLLFDLQGELIPPNWYKENASIDDEDVSSSSMRL